METKDFLLRKFKSFCPEVFLAYIVGFLTFAIALKPDLPKMLMQTFSEFLLINMSGLWVTKMNTAIWYLSSMLFAMAILYPLLRKFNTTVLYIVIPISSLFLLGWLCANGLSPRGPLEWAGWTYRGNIRALAELGIGICLYPVVEKVKRIDFTIFARCLLTAVEYACYILIIYYMYEKTASRLDYFYLLVFAVALTISFSQKGIDSSLFKGRFFWLGKYSFSLFLSHYFYAKTVKIFSPSTLVTSFL